MSRIPFTPWPAEAAQRYRELGYWTDLPLTEMLRRQAAERPDHPAVLCGERVVSYGELASRSDRLASALWRRGLRGGDTALVQLPNVGPSFTWCISRC